jgi:hypothetical protein
VDRDRGGHVLLGAHHAELDAVRERRLDVECGELRDEDRLLLVRDEAGRGQSLRQVGRTVVGVVLPLGVPADRRETLDGARDLGIGGLLVEIGPHDGAPVAAEAVRRALVALDPRLGVPEGGVATHLLVEEGED